jgi:hypothetical protein
LAGMVICLPSRRTLTSEGNMPAMEAMVRPVEKSCHAFYTLAVSDGISRRRTKAVWIVMTTKMTMARAKLET